MISSKYIEHDLSSIINLLPFNSYIFFLNLLILIISFGPIIFSLIIFLAFLILLKKNIFLVLLIISLEFGIGLLGPSEPLIFKIQATFSGELTNK